LDERAYAAISDKGAYELRTDGLAGGAHRLRGAVGLRLLVAAMNRRNFMADILLTGTAPAIVRAESLMRVNPPGIIVRTPGPVWPDHPQAGDLGILMVNEQVLYFDAERWPITALVDPAPHAVAVRVRETYNGNGKPTVECHWRRGNEAPWQPA
jgi:hypothetical protein